MGFWFYYAPGSGTFLRLGRTMAFSDHDAAFMYLCQHASRRYGLAWCAGYTPGRRYRSGGPEAAIAQLAYAHGLDTVQFTMLLEAGNGFQGRGSGRVVKVRVRASAERQLNEPRWHTAWRT